MAETLETLSKELTRLRKSGDYAGVLETYRKTIAGAFSAEDIARNEWVLWAVLQAYRKQRYFFDAWWWFMHELGITRPDGQSVYVLRELGWSLFMILKQWRKEPEKTVETAKRYTLMLPDITTGMLGAIDIQSEYLLYTRLLFEFTEAERKRPNPDYSRIISLLQMVQPQQLSEENKPDAGASHTYEPMTDRERWYSLMTQVLQKSGEYERCRDIAQEALNTLETFHFDNDVWFTRRLAISEAHTGDTENALQHYTEIYSRKQDWFIAREIATLYHYLNKPDTALTYCIEAVSASGKLPFKADVFYLMGLQYDALNHSTKADTHYYIYRQLRQQEGWRIPDKRAEHLEQRGIPHIKKSESLQELLHTLSHEWEEDRIRYSSVPRYTGYISKILHAGKNGDGFITGENGTGYYFRIQHIRDAKKEIHEGAPVTYELKSTTYKGKHVYNAIRIKLSGNAEDTEGNNT